MQKPRWLQTYKQNSGWCVHPLVGQYAEYRSFVVIIVCVCFSIDTQVFGLAQKQIQWGLLVPNPPHTRESNGRDPSHTGRMT